MISVCLTTYNGSLFLKEQIDSILCQLNKDDEIIISDDGSIDNTISIIESYNDCRIKIFYHTPIKNQYRFDLTTRNFENALFQAKGDYIFFADQDDIWKSNKVGECMKLFYEGYDLILHDCDIVDEKNGKIANSYFEINKSKSGIIKNIIKNSYLGCCMAINRKYIDRVLPFSKTPIPHDIWIGLLYEYYGNIIYSKKKLISYRRHGANVSPSGEKSNNKFIFKIKYRMLFIYSFLNRII